MEVINVINAHGFATLWQVQFRQSTKIGQGISIDRARLHKVNDCMASNRNATGVRRLS